MIHPFQVAKGVLMRRTDEASGALFSYVDLEARVPAGHPLRNIRWIVNDALASLDAAFDAELRQMAVSPHAVHRGFDWVRAQFTIQGALPPSRIRATPPGVF